MAKKKTILFIVGLLVILLQTMAMTEGYPTFVADKEIEGLYYWTGTTEPEEDLVSEEESKKIKKLILPSNMKGYNGYYNYQIDALEEYIIDESSTFLTCVEGVLFTKDMTVLLAYPKNKTSTEYIIPDGVIRIGNNAFAGNESLKLIVFSNEIKSVGCSAFEGCSSLKDIRFNDTLSCIENNAFKDCSSLVTLVFPKELKVIGYRAFYMSSLADISLNNELVCIMSEAFYTHCFDMAKIKLPTSVLYLDRTAFSPDESITLMIPQDSVFRYTILDGVAEYTDD